MRVLIQRVKTARVIVADALIAEIGRGLLVFAGFSREDSNADGDCLAKKILNLRIFNDPQCRMNLNISQAEGSILSVSQFTLYADTARGNRPGFDPAAPAEKAEELWRQFNAALGRGGVEVRQGIFGAQMQVELVNDGPVTIWLDSRSQA